MDGEVPDDGIENVSNRDAAWVCGTPWQAYVAPGQSHMKYHTTDSTNTHEPVTLIPTPTSCTAAANNCHTNVLPLVHS